MKRIKVYTVVCSIYENGHIVNIPLSKLIDRLDMKPDISNWSIDYDLEYLVWYYLKKGFKVRYRKAETFVTPYEGYQLPPFHAMTEDGLGNTDSYMNRAQDKIFYKLNLEDGGSLLYRYGNDYTKQAKGERYL